MTKLKKKILESLLANPKIKAKEETVRSQISRIRAEHPGLTLNAAASLYAKKRGITIMGRLSPEDRQGLQSVQSISQIPIRGNPSRKIKVRPVAPSFGGLFLKDANQNAGIYPYIYILENSLRTLIQNILGSDRAWWNKKVGRDVQDYATRIMDAERRHDWLPKRGNHPIYYIGLNELFKIINKHYNVFKHIFTDQGYLRTWINESVPIRNLLAHNVKVSREDGQNLIIRAKYICTQIENNSNKPTSKP